jgi:hypothetical protein
MNAVGAFSGSPLSALNNAKAGRLIDLAESSGKTCF